MRPIEVPFENTTLPGYYLELDHSPRPVVMMVGGGDTFREDLFYFADYPGWKRGYNVLMVGLARARQIAWTWTAFPRRYE